MKFRLANVPLPGGTNFNGDEANDDAVMVCANNLSPTFLILNLLSSEFGLLKIDEVVGVAAVVTTAVTAKLPNRPPGLLDFKRLKDGGSLSLLIFEFMKHLQIVQWSLVGIYW